MKQTKRRVACVAAAATLGLVMATVVAVPASAGYRSINSNGCVAQFSNWNDSLGGVVRTNVNAGASCGPIYLNGKWYYGGGVYAYPASPVYYGTGTGQFTLTNTRVLNQSRHYYTIPGGQPTYTQVNL